MKRDLLPAAPILFSVWLLTCVPSVLAKEPAYNYLERSPARIAILPSVNRTDQPGAEIVLDKAWERALNYAGFEIVSADRVITYAANRGLLLSELGNKKISELGHDLKVDLLLKSEIFKWTSSSKGEQARTTVEAVARIIEVSTGAVLWEHHWLYEETSSSGLGKLFDAAMDIASDKASRMGNRAVLKLSASKLPRAGFSPRRR
jgi:hypothetical protein